MSGFDFGKLNDPNKIDPKYVFGRASQRFDTRSQSGRDSLLASLRADPSGFFKNATLNNDILDVGANADSSFDGVRQFDVFSGSKAGDWNAWWNPLNTTTSGSPSSANPYAPGGEWNPGNGGFSSNSTDPSTPPDINGGYPPVGQVTPVVGGGSMGSIPADLIGLRSLIGAFLNQHLTDMPTPYGGQLTTGMDPRVDQGLQMFLSQMFPQLGASNSMATGATGVNNQGAGILGAGAGNLSSLFSNGGAPDIQKALDDIRTKGMTDIMNSNAQTQAEYGTMGLSRGSDVAGAVARGSASGIADINAQQSTLAANILSQGADRRLQALGIAPSYAGAIQDPYNQAFQRQLQAAGITGQNALGFGQGASAFTQAGQFGTALNQSNIQNVYNEWVRQQTPPYLNAAIGYASGYTPNPSPIPTSSSSGGWGQFLGMILPFLFK